MTKGLQSVHETEEWMGGNLPGGSFCGVVAAKVRRRLVSWGRGSVLLVTILGGFLIPTRSEAQFQVPVRTVTIILPPDVQFGLHYFAVQDLESGDIIQRGEAGSGGFAFDQLIMAPNTELRIWILQASTLSTGYLDITSPDNGVNVELPEIRVGTDLSPDPDGDGLGDDGELVMGSNANDPDADMDGIQDGAEVSQGTNPTDGLQISTGIIGSAGTPGSAIDVDAFNDVVVVADSVAGIAVFNIFNAMDPVIIAQVNTPGSSQSISLAGNRVAVADGVTGADHCRYLRPSCCRDHAPGALWRSGIGRGIGSTGSVCRSGYR